MLYVHISDVDACALNISGCSQICTNTMGGYNCSCYSGYYLEVDLMNCTGMYSVLVTMELTI